MTGQDHNNLSAGEAEKAKQLDDEFIPNDAHPLCSNCLKDHIQPMPLVNAKQGERFEITDFTGGATARIRLSSMGLRIGDKIDVINNLDKGQLVIAVAHQRYVLGRGLAKKILIEPIRS